MTRPRRCRGAGAAMFLDLSKDNGYDSGMTQVPGDKTKDTVLLPGERRAANGVIIGSGAEPGIPRFGADETDSGCAEPEPSVLDEYTFCRDFPVLAARMRALRN
jgi:hypothetical protein